MMVGIDAEMIFLPPKSCRLLSGKNQLNIFDGYSDCSQLNCLAIKIKSEHRHPTFHFRFQFFGFISLSKRPSDYVIKLSTYITFRKKCLLHVFKVSIIFGIVTDSAWPYYVSY